MTCLFYFFCLVHGNIKSTCQPCVAIEYYRSTAFGTAVNSFVWGVFLLMLLNLIGHIYCRPHHPPAQGHLPLATKRVMVKRNQQVTKQMLYKMKRKKLRKVGGKCRYFVMQSFAFVSDQKHRSPKLSMRIWKSNLLKLYLSSSSQLSSLRSSNHLGNQSQFFSHCGPICYMIKKTKRFFLLLSLYCLFQVSADK